jgi:uncharacterized protein
VRGLVCVTGLAVALTAIAARAETPIPPPPTAFVTDQAHALSPATVSELDARLAATERGTGHQVLVYVDRTTGGTPIEDWAVRAFERWRVGRRGIDDGVVLFLFTDDHRARIEVGYGLEGVLPDARASRIIREDVVPHMRAGDADGAVREAVAALISSIGGDRGPGKAPEADAPPIPRFALVIGGLLLLLLLIGGATHPALAAWLLFEIGGRGGRGGGFGGGGGWGGGGGGFSGGGGSSGGGGASGSW